MAQTRKEREAAQLAAIVARERNAEGAIKLDLGKDWMAPVWRRTPLEPLRKRTCQATREHIMREDHAESLRQVRREIRAESERERMDRKRAAKAAAVEARRTRGEDDGETLLTIEQYELIRSMYELNYAQIGHICNAAGQTANAWANNGRIPNQRARLLIDWLKATHGADPPPRESAHQALLDRAAATPALSVAQVMRMMQAHRVSWSRLARVCSITVSSVQSWRRLKGGMVPPRHVARVLAWCEQHGYVMPAPDECDVDPSEDAQ